MRALRGSCLCGTFRFEVRGKLLLLKNCHCSRCRKMSGSTFATYARAEAKHLFVLAGSHALITYERCPGNTIAFCRQCGTLVPFPPPGSPLVEFGAGLLDDDPGLGIGYHIYVASRAPWCVLEDGLPQYDENRVDGG
jgi:hypothetical protein